MAAGPGAGEVSDIRNDVGLEQSRYQQNLNPLTGQKLSVNQYMGKLASENPYLMQANPALAYSLAQQYQSGLIPSDVNSQLRMTQMIKKATDPYAKLYGSNVGMRNNPNEKAPNWWEQAVTGGTNWFEQNVFNPIHNFINTNPFARYVNQSLNYSSQGAFNLQSFIGGAQGLVGTIGGTSIAAYNAGQKTWERNQNPLGLATGGLSGLAETLGHGLYSAVAGPNNVLFAAKHYIAYYDSLKNTYGSEYANGVMAGNIIPGFLTGGLFAPGEAAAAAGEASSLAALNAGEAGALNTGTLALESAPETLAFKQLLSKEALGTPLSTNEQVQMSALADHLNAQDQLALPRAIYDTSVETAKNAATKSAKGISYNEVVDALSQVNIGKLSRQDFNTVIAKYIPPGQLTSFEEAAGQLSRTDIAYGRAIAREEADNYANAKQAFGAKYREMLTNASKPLGKLPGQGFRAVGKINKLLGGTQANATYLYAAAQAQSDPALQRIWEATKGGQVINADGTTTDLGLKLAQSVGINGMWGTFTKDLIDLDLNWVVNDPVAAGLNLTKEARSFYGYSGILGNLFPGTGIRVAGDAHRAYDSYSSVRRAIDYIAKHDFAEISRTFKNTFSRPLIEKLAEAKSAQEVLSILEDVRGGLAIVGDRMPVMGWYSLSKTVLRGNIAKELAVPGKELATLGDVIATNDPLAKALRDSIEEQTGVNITVDDIGYANLDPASRAQIKAGERLRQQFSTRPMSVESQQVLDYELKVGSPQSIAKMTEWLKRAYMSDEFIKSAGDALARAGLDHEKWNHALDNVFELVVYNHIAASMPYAEFLPHLEAVQSRVREALSVMTGLDGGGRLLSSSFVDAEESASKLAKEDADYVLKDNAGPFEAIKQSAGIDEQHIGTRRIPKYQDLRDLARFTTEVVSKSNRTKIGQYLIDARTPAEHIEKMTESWVGGDVNVGTKLEKFNPDKNAEHFASDEGQKAYRVRAKELLADLSWRSYSGAVVHLQQIIDDGQIRIGQMKSDLRTIEMSNVDPAKAKLDRFGTDIGAQIDRLEYELKSAQDIMLMLKSDLSKSFLGSDNMRKAARFASSLISNPEKTLRDTYEEEFRKIWFETGEKQAWGKFGGFLDHVLKNPGFLGTRGMRTNFGIVEDMLQWNMNVYFKRWALLSEAWALHVSLSEGILNGIRLGGGNFFKSQFAFAVVKHEADFGKLAMGDREFRFLRDSVGAVVLGLQKGLLEGMAPKEYERFLQNATDLFIMNDGHLPMGVHGTGGVVTGDGLGRVNTDIDEIPVINGNGDIQTVKGRLTDDYQKYDAGHKFGGAALYAAITTTNKGRLGRETANLLDQEFMRLGQEKWNSATAYYENEARRRAEFAVRESGAISEDTGEISAKASQKEYEKAKADIIRGLGAEEIDLEKFRPTLVKNVQDFIEQQSPEWRSQFRRNTQRSAMYPDLSPVEGWANSVVDHIYGLTSRKGTPFPDILGQIATGEFWSRQKTTEWLNDRFRANEPVPTGFPAPKITEGWKSQGVSNFAWLNEKVHAKWLGPIVNSLVRDPVFNYEYHIEMERLLPKVEEGTITKDEAMITAQTNAVVHMSKFVHNPLDKLTWEENMRIMAPFYFAKNQAWRRAFRLFGEDPAKFEKYLKANLLVTDTIARARTKNGTLSYVIPGSQFILGLLSFGGFETGPFALQGSANSPDSYIITGNASSLSQFATNMVQIPYSNVVTIPAKIVHDYFQFRVPLISKIISSFPVVGLGETSMRGSWKSDLIPSTTAQNIISLFSGAALNTIMPGKYASLENYVLTSMAEAKFTDFYNQAQKNLIAEGQITLAQVRDGSAAPAIQAAALYDFSRWFKEPNNKQDLMNQASAHTAILFSIKTVGSFLSPTSLTVTAAQSAQKDIAKIAQEKGKDGKLLYPTYFQQADEFMTRYPKRIFELVPHTSSPYTTYPETKGAFDFVNAHPAFAKTYEFLTPSLTPSIGKAANYDPAAVTLFEKLGLRNQATTTDTMNAIAINMGNDLYYNVMTPQFQKEYPGTYQSGMSRQGAKALADFASSYGNSVNMIWHEDFAKKASTYHAAQAYEEAQKLIENKNDLSVLPTKDQQALAALVSARKQYETLYNQAGSKSAQSQLSNEWYNTMTGLLSEKVWQPYTNLITTVFRKIPNPK